MEGNNDAAPSDGPGAENDPLSVSFDKAFPKSDEIEAIRGIEKIVYGYSKKGMFNLLSILVGIPISLVWGLVLGICSFFLIWFVYPALVKPLPPSHPLHHSSHPTLTPHSSHAQAAVKMFYSPAAQLVGHVLDSVFGTCLSRLASKGNQINVQPAVVQTSTKGKDVEAQLAYAPQGGIPLSTDGGRGY